MSKTEIFINKAIKIHGNKYDYSKVNYKNAITKVCIICPEHGEFWQTPTRHLEGRECIRCAANKKGKKIAKSKEIFIEQAKKIHKNIDGTPIFDYSKVEYINTSTKVCIIDHRINPNTNCEFGEFWQTPNKHLTGRGNELFSYIIKRGVEKRIDNDDFIEKCKKIHNNKFDYSNTIYNGTSKYITFECNDINPNTGEKYGKITQLASHHKKGYLPSIISYVNIGIDKRKTTEKFINDAIKIHGNKYNYNKVIYIKDGIDVCITCSKHGDFWQKPNKHLNLQGCPKCKTSKLQTKNRICLENNNIKYIEECNKKILPFIKNFRLDFYLPDYNIAIECQGGQHFKSNNYFGGNEGFTKTVNRDIEKNKICEKNNITILYLIDTNKLDLNLLTSDLFCNLYNSKNVFYNENDIIKYLNNHNIIY